jgi:hypothetical protein
VVTLKNRDFHPLFSVVNSYNGRFGLGWDVGFLDAKSGSTVVTRRSVRSVRFGVGGAVDKIGAGAEKAWVEFEKIVEDLARMGGAVPVRGVLVLGGETKAWPIKIVAAMHDEWMKSDSKNHSQMDLLRVFSSVLTKMSPLRSRDLDQKAFDFLSDPNLIEKAKAVTSAQVLEWFPSSTQTVNFVPKKMRAKQE